ncbi:hypothetical protein C1645_810345 [Glomus cerebriforme]|uniref:Uncharacterized protein n=1 Tax=Glomus cerebriforme TaxID=658196 RepID=A0A397S3X1_9GLOM|nr:hypothetical protein C1645_810345 [Glomus cerebriforme]
MDGSNLSRDSNTMRGFERNNINGNGYNSNGQNGNSQNGVGDGNNNGNQIYKGFPKFSANVDVVECGTNGVLSNNWSQLAEEGYGYFLGSLKIEIIPIANVPNNKTELIWQEYLFPEEKNNSIEHINNSEKQANFEISATPKAGVQNQTS